MNMVEVQLWRATIVSQTLYRTIVEWSREDDAQDRLLVDERVKDHFDYYEFGDYRRPTCKEDIMDWLEEHEVVNKERMMNIIGMLKKDKSLYLKFV